MQKILIPLLLTVLLAFSAVAQNVKEIDQDQFKQLVGLADKGNWTTTAQRPCVVDFNADWCGPCRRLAPVLKELARERTDIDFYSVNVDDNKELAETLRISSIPMLLIVPVQGDPQAIVGLYPKEELIKVFDYVFNGKTEVEE